MAEEPIPVSSKSPNNFEFLKAPDLQMVLQDYAQARRELGEEKRNGERKLLEERERSRWEAERLRSEYEIKLKAIEHENWALVRAIGRINAENDRLREEVAIARFSKGNDPLPSASEAPQEKKVSLDKHFAPMGQIPVPVLNSGDSLIGKGVTIGLSKK